MKHFRLLISSTLFVFGLMANAQAQVQIVETIAGGGSSLGDGGLAINAQFSGNYFIVLDSFGNLYISDQTANRIRMITASTGIITTIGGTGTYPGTYSGDLGPATAAKINTPIGIAVIPNGDSVYFSDEANNRIRLINMVTGIITTIAGTGTASSTGDGGAAATATVWTPKGISVDRNKNVYFAEAGTGGGGTASNKVRMISAATGIITTVAGTANTTGFAGDGGLAIATACKLSGPRGVTLDAADNIYIADEGNDRIRMVSASTGIITTVAGWSPTTPAGAYGGDGGSAIATACRLNAPTDIRFDPAGNMYIADQTNNRIRSVSPAGIITTIVDASGTGALLDGRPATAAEIKEPLALAILPNGNYYISDYGNVRIREAYPNHAPYFSGATRDTLNICENASAPASLSSILSTVDSDKNQTETWTLLTGSGLGPFNGSVPTSTTAASNGGLVSPPGSYGYTVASGISGLDSFVIQVSDGIAIAYDTVIVVINPLPVVAPVTGGGITTVCQLATLPLGDDSTGGVWSASNAHATVNSTSGLVTGATVGTDVISYTITNACGPTRQLYTVTVNPLPNAGTITGSVSSVCTGTTIVLTDAAPGGTWTSAIGNATVVAGTVTGVTVGSETISYTTSNSCGAVSALYPLSVIALPDPTVSTTGGAAAVVCQDASIVLTDASASGTWSASNGNATVTAGAVTGVTPGTDDISFTATNACGTTVGTLTVTVNPIADAGILSGPTGICIGGSPITILDLGGTTGGIWSASNGNATVTSGVVSAVSAGNDTIGYNVTNSCGTITATINIAVTGIPDAGTVTGPTSVCPGSYIVLSDAIVGGTWTSSTTGVSVSNDTVNGVTPGTALIYYTVSYTCGTATATYPITINAFPAPAAISGASGVCVGSTTLLTDVSSGGSWSVSNSSASVTGGLVLGVSAGTDTIMYSLTNVCGTVAASMPIAVNPIITPAVTFTGSLGFTTCPGQPVTYIATPVNGGAAPVYQWRVNAFVLGATNTFTYTPTTGDRIICTMTSDAGCISTANAADTVTVVVKPTLTPSVHISTGVLGDTVCISTPTTFTATPVNGGTTPNYQWTVNGTAAAVGNPYTYIPSNGDIVAVALTSSYQCPSPATVTSNSVTMTVNTTELPTVSITVNPGNPICAGASATFTVHSLYEGLTPFYRWTINGLNVATGPTHSYTPSNGDVVYAMLASSSSCSIADSVFSNHITMATETAPSISVSITAVQGISIGIGQMDTMVAVVTSTALSPTYQWFLNGVPQAGATSAIYIYSRATAGSDIVTCAVTTGDACDVNAVSSPLNMSVGVTLTSVKQEATVTGELKLLPNPNNGTFTMNLLSDNDEQAQVVITNIVGEKVKEFTIATNKDAEIKLNQAPGLYFISATTAQGKYVAKVVVN